MKLDRLIAKHACMGRTAALRAIATRRVRVRGTVITDGHVEVDRFDHVTLDAEVVQAAQRALHILMHKPIGHLSATQDTQHPTVLDLIDDPDKHTLHLAGRLDRASSGLLLLTNDGHWSQRLMSAASKVPKLYHVETQQPIPPAAIEAFARGFYFHTEDITTLPAELVITSEHRAHVTLHEGRYHQIKRMFHRVGCRVTALHRARIGHLHLPPDLAPGCWREMTAQEIEWAATA